MSTLPAKESKAKALERLRHQSNSCRSCVMGSSKLSYVFGEGPADAALMFVGEAPGRSEDIEGRPFVGRSGRLLEQFLETIGLHREEVYITSVVKCHPMKDPQHPYRRGNDRTPTKTEINACLPVLLEQIDIIQPEVICTLGNVATQALLRTREGVNKLHGKPLPYKGAVLIPTFHPAAVLRNPSLMQLIKKDFKILGRSLG